MMTAAGKVPWDERGIVREILQLVMVIPRQGSG